MGAIYYFGHRLWDKPPILSPYTKSFTAKSALATF